MFVVFVEYMLVKSQDIFVVRLLCCKRKKRSYNGPSLFYPHTDEVSKHVFVQYKNIRPKFQVCEPSNVGSELIIKSVRVNYFILIVNQRSKALLLRININCAHNPPFAIL